MLNGQEEGLYLVKILDDVLNNLLIETVPNSIYKANRTMKQKCKQLLNSKLEPLHAL